MKIEILYYNYQKVSQPIQKFIRKNMYTNMYINKIFCTTLYLQNIDFKYKMTRKTRQIVFS